MLNTLNYYWRLLATALSFTVFGIGGVLVPLVATPIIHLTSKTPAERQRKARLLIHRTFLAFVHFMRLMGVLTWQLEHGDRLQRRRLLVLANHPTLLDVVFLVAFIPHADCIVKGKLAHSPAMRGFIRMTGFITNDVGPDLIEATDDSLQRGSALIIFPEGTRTVPGQPLALQRGAANVALRTVTDITPVLIDCTPITLSKSHRWYHIPPKKMHFTLSVMPDIPVAPYTELRPSVAARRLTDDLQQYFTEELQHYDHSA